jgi:hypothetical protein
MELVDETSLARASSPSTSAAHAQSSSEGEAAVPLTPTPAPLSEEEIRAKLHAVFESFDKDASGAVSIDEMFEMCSNLNLGMSEDELRRLLSEADADGSGEIDFDEFVAALQKSLSGEAGAGAGLGAVFAAQSRSMLGDLGNLWSHATSIFSSPFQSLDSLTKTTRLSLTGVFLAEEPPPPQPHFEDADEAEPAPLQLIDAPFIPSTVYGAWDLNVLPPRKAVRATDRSTSLT